MFLLHFSRFKTFLFFGHSKIKVRSCVLCVYAGTPLQTDGWTEAIAISPTLFQRELSIIDFTLNYPPIRNNLTSASLLSMLIETDYLNYPLIRNNLTSASLLSMIIEMDYNLVGYESQDRAALPRQNLPR